VQTWAGLPLALRWADVEPACRWVDATSLDALAPTFPLQEVT